jgi:5'-deoxynucleotidase YfbR-like HD superfamily hydrolase
MTYSGTKFWPLDPRPEDLNLADIAHALSNICRYGGHCKNFYSVAEHCVLMSEKVTGRNKLWALLHDATEAYLMDLPRPIKPYLPGYAEYETKLMKCIAERYGLPYEMPAEVKDADNRIIFDEMTQNMSYVPDKYKALTPLGVTLEYWTPNEARRHFVDAFFVSFNIYEEEMKRANDPLLQETAIFNSVKE